MTVSVIIPAYDVASIITRAIESVVQQTLPAAEIIVIDDASRDNTRNVVRKLSELQPQIKLLSLETNRGPAHARNVGIAAARGTWVAILDADDAWKPDRLRRLVEIAQFHKADFVADNQILYDAAAEKEVRPGLIVSWDHQVLDVKTMFLNDIVEVTQYPYSGLKPILRREFLATTCVKYDEAVRYGEDFKFYCELLFNGAKAVLISEAYYVYSTRIGELSREFSPHSKSTSRFDQLACISDDLKEKYQKKITPEIDAAMQRRKEQILLIHAANVARGFRQARQYIKYTSYLLKRPRVIRLLFIRLVRRFVFR